MTSLYALIRPLLFRLDAERAHDLTAKALRVTSRAPLLPRLVYALYAWEDPLLAVDWSGLHFANPVGVAAGFDKRADLVDGLALLGFGHIEVGTVTPRPQPGNPRPRLFRLPEDAALINRLGFNSPGMVAVARALRARRSLSLASISARTATRHWSAPLKIMSQPSLHWRHSPTMWRSTSHRRIRQACVACTNARRSRRSCTN
jgi:hypothetical protein